MERPRLPPDFAEFLRLLNAHGVDYLLVGGYAVSYYGHPRATADIDIWIAVHPANADRVVAALTDFGFAVPALSPDLFVREDQIVRLGEPPLRIEILTNISGVAFEECFAARVQDTLEEVPVSIISLDHLKVNKRAAGRNKDLEDLENLP